MDLFPDTQASSFEDAYLLDSTELDFLNTFERIDDDNTPLLQQDDLEREEDMTPVSCVTSLPTPKGQNEEIEDNCVIYGGASAFDESPPPECPPAPVLKDLSTFDGSGIGDFDIDYDEEAACNEQVDDSVSFTDSLQCLGSADSLDFIYSWLSAQDNSYLTDGYDDYTGDAGMRNKRTRSVALSDDVEECRPHPPPQCMLGLTELYPPRHMPPD